MHPQPEALQGLQRGSSVWLRQNFRKPHIAERSLSFQSGTHMRARLVFEQISMKSVGATKLQQGFRKGGC